MALCEKILIVGFSGAGKTSFLEQLEQLAPAGWGRFEDLDHLILKNHSKGHGDLASLIGEVGWDQFRIWERQELEGQLKEEGKMVLALGGGSLNPLVWELYRHSRRIRFLYLKTSFETCWERLLNAKEERPLVKLGKAKLYEVFQEREKLFEQIEWRLQNEGKSDLKAIAKAFWLQSKGAADTIS